MCICAKSSVLTAVRLFAILLISYTNLKVNVSISSSILSFKFLLWNLYDFFYDFWPAYSDWMLTRRSRFSCFSWCLCTRGARNTLSSWDAVGICATHLHINEALQVLAIFYLPYRLGLIRNCTKGAAFAPRAFARAAAFPRFIQLFITWRKSS